MAHIHPPLSLCTAQYVPPLSAPPPSWPCVSLHARTLSIIVRASPATSELVHATRQPQLRCAPLVCPAPLMWRRCIVHCPRPTTPVWRISSTCRDVMSCCRNPIPVCWSTIVTSKYGKRCIKRFPVCALHSNVRWENGCWVAYRTVGYGMYAWLSFCLACARWVWRNVSLGAHRIAATSAHKCSYKGNVERGILEHAIALPW